MSGNDGSHERADYHVVVDIGAGGIARDFIVSERVFNTIQEGQTQVRALPGWQSRQPDEFEVLP